MMNRNESWGDAKSWEEWESQWGDFVEENKSKQGEMMPVNNVNSAALERVVEAAKRYMQISEWLGHSPLDDETATLDTCIFMVEQKLKKERE